LCDVITSAAIDLQTILANVPHPEAIRRFDSFDYNRFGAMLTYRYNSTAMPIQSTYQVLMRYILRDYRMY
jgi:hypothetical protein